MLQPGLLDAARREDLWKKSARKQAYLVGFLQALPDDLPPSVAPRADAAALASALQSELDAGNLAARLLLRAVGAQGQTYLKTVAAVLAKPPNQDVVSAAFDCLRAYCAAVRPDGDPDLSVEALGADAELFVAADAAPTFVRACLDALPSAHADLFALRFLSGAGYGLIRPVLRDPTTLGSLMRRKLAPVLDPLQQQIARLRGEAR